MNGGAVNILAAAAVGLGATLLMDLWNRFLGIGLYVWALGVSYVLRPASGE